MISVIIPTYNRAGTLLAAAQSVLQQTYRDIELIIVDDGSTDDTAKVVSALQDGRVRYIPLGKNCGACAARNRGIDEAKGEYIAFQDSDDLWHSDKLEREFAFLQRENADVVFCAIRRYALGSREARRFPYTDPSGLLTQKEMFQDLLSENTVAMVTVLCRRACAIETRFDESLPRGQDWDWAIRASRNYKMRYLDAELVDSYAQKDSISYAPDKLHTALEIMYRKYRGDIERDAALSASWVERRADAAFGAGVSAAALCWRAFCLGRKGKYLIKWLLCALRLQGPYLRVREERTRK